VSAVHIKRRRRSTSSPPASASSKCDYCGRPGWLRELTSGQRNRWAAWQAGGDGAAARAAGGGRSGWRGSIRAEAAAERRRGQRLRARGLRALWVGVSGERPARRRA
jgi:hypothetical protein